MGKEEKRLPKVIAVDFDGTLVEDKFPEIGAVNEEVLNYCKEEQKAGARIILWTSRTKKRLEDAVAWCKDHDFNPDTVNENIPEVVELYGGDCRKVFASEFIDDRMCTKFCFAKSEMDTLDH